MLFKTQNGLQYLDAMAVLADAYTLHICGPWCMSLRIYHISARSMDSAVERALASYQGGWVLIPGPSVICGLSLLLVLVLAPRVFLRVLCFSFLHTKKNTSIGNSRATGLSVARLFRATLAKQVDFFRLSPENQSKLKNCNVT